jgi:hypothetical protein
MNSLFIVSLLSAVKLGLGSTVDDVSYGIMVDTGLPTGFFNLPRDDQNTLWIIFAMLRESAVKNTVFKSPARYAIDPVKIEIDALASTRGEEFSSNLLA